MKRSHAMLPAMLLAMLMQPRADATAQALADPTRPPGMLEAEPGAGTTSAPVLQSVMISPAARTAIIGGETVRLGGRYGEARVVKITESEVVLRSAGGTEILRMYPGVELSLPKASVPAAPKAPRKSAAPRN
jgi:MSHA biogenesis protein MshK